MHLLSAYYFQGRHSEHINYACNPESASCSSSYNKATTNAKVAETENWNRGKGDDIKSHREVGTREEKRGGEKSEAVEQH